MRSNPSYVCLSAYGGVCPNSFGRITAALRSSFSGLMPALEPLLFPLQLQAKTMHVGRDHRERHRATKPLLTMRTNQVQSALVQIVDR